MTMGNYYCSVTTEKMLELAYLPVAMHTSGKQILVDTQVLYKYCYLRTLYNLPLSWGTVGSNNYYI